NVLPALKCVDQAGATTASSDELLRAGAAELTLQQALEGVAITTCELGDDVWQSQWVAAGSRQLAGQVFRHVQRRVAHQREGRAKDCSDGPLERCPTPHEAWSLGDLRTVDYRGKLRRRDVALNLA